MATTTPRTKMGPGKRTNAAEYFLRTDRLGFREWSQDDLELALGLWGDRRVTRFIDSRVVLSTADVGELLSKEIATARQHGVQYWPIFRLDDGKHVGCCGLRPRDPKKRIYELGFHIRSAHWGRGYASEAARAVIAYAFGRLGARSLFAGHGPGNDASRRVLEKLRFRHTHDELYEATGLNHPCYRLEGERDELE